MPAASAEAIRNKYDTNNERRKNDRLIEKLKDQVFVKAMKKKIKEVLESCVRLRTQKLQAELETVKCRSNCHMRAVASATAVKKMVIAKHMALGKEFKQMSSKLAATENALKNKSIEVERMKRRAR